MNHGKAALEVKNQRSAALLIVGHSDDGGGWLMVKSGERVLARVVLPPFQKDQLGYELLLGNKFGSGVLPVTLV